jgi:hypothetical protein
MANHLAKRLAEDGLNVDLLITVDAAAAWKTDDVDRTVSSNVKKNINIYQTNESSVGSHGGRNTAKSPKSTKVVNNDYSNYYEGTP